MTSAPPQRGRVTALDGIRGGFMLLFMLYHLGVPGLDGAWTGLSLFFVLSAYLITRLLLRERRRFGGVDVPGFYRRRARRLMPALILLLLALGVCGLLVADEFARRQLRGDMLASLGFVMNWRLVLDADQYFSTFGSPSLLRHAWTLSVEEQFYLCVPLLLAILALMRRRVAMVVLALAAVGSAWWTAQVGLGDASAIAHAYYGTDTRAQSLLIGMLVAFIDDGWRDRTPAVLRRCGPVLAWTMLATALALLVVVEPMEPFMFLSGGLLLQAIVVGLLILPLAHGVGGSAGRVLSWAPLAYLGVRSYGLYLFHWPLTVWFGQAFPTAPVWVAAPVVLAISIAAAAASYRWIEEPVMRRGVRGLLPRLRRPGRVAVAAPLGVVLVALAVGQVGATASQVGGRSVDVPPLVAGSAAYDPREKPTRIAFYGDSVADNLVTYFPSADYPDLLVSGLAVPGCDVVDLKPAWNEELGGAPDAECRRSWTNLGERLRDLDADTVVMVLGTLISIPHYSPEGEVWWLQDRPYRRAVEEALDGLVAQAESAGVTPQIATVPCRIDGRQGQAPALRTYFEAHPDVAEATSDPKVVNSWIRAWARDRDVAVLDLYEVLECSEGFRPEVNGVNLYGDQLHFSDEGAAMVWTWLAPRVRDHASRAGTR
ncbi:acyltransferase family protein [Aeromicrobium senzhongii]|uniref:Acyltransferase family protein n=1 Tax=Aeromicrobium senzhongii TaxID=2663859 RepID=A0ABX6SPV5_9ACTN|nr:acyltransferase family protein [Aeromicrobium senzhongii]MTB86873.1 acyltransferase family protein [Aeromicrobium senzhongii]QNL93292.1 acyltransferase family protein [Aeromicrobium senzhongii]